MNDVRHLKNDEDKAWLDGYREGQKQNSLDLIIAMQNLLMDYIDKSRELFKKYGKNSDIDNESGRWS